MPLDRLTDMLTSDDAAADDAVVLYECRHCGTKFEKPRKQCPVCDATEIATYEFECGDDRDEGADGLNENEEERDEGEEHEGMDGET